MNGDIEIDKFVLMQNHIRVIIIIKNKNRLNRQIKNMRLKSRSDEGVNFSWN